MELEAGAGIFLLHFFGIVMICMLYSFFVEPVIDKIKIAIHKKKEPKVLPISLEEAQNLIDKASFWTAVKEVASGTSKEPPLEGSSFVEALQPCLGGDCPLHETRADHCNSYKYVGKDRMCRVIINLENMQETGLANNSDKLLTEEEVKQLGDHIVDFCKRNSDKQG